MNNLLYDFLMVLTMAIITYLIRLIPMVLFKKKIKNRFINSLLYYLPYAVLSAMTFPFILFGGSHIVSSAIGAGVALVAAFLKRSLVTVAVLASIAVLISELVIIYVI